MKTAPTSVIASLLLTSFAALASAHPRQAQGAARPLVLGEKAEHELAKGETHTYTIPADAGDFLHVLVVQRGADVVVELRGPAGTRLIEEDTSLGDAQAEWITCEAKEGGVYTLLIRPVDANARAGRYTIQLEERRPAQPGDAARLSAEAVFLEANAAFAKGTPDSNRDALGKYERAAAMYQQAGRRLEEAVAHNSAAAAAAQLSDDATVLRPHVIRSTVVGSSHRSAAAS